MKKNVNLRITSNQYIEELKPSGDAFRREMELEDTTEIRTYIEDGEGFEDLRTMFKVEDGSLRIRKYAKVDDDEEMDMTLSPGTLNITKFHLPQSSYFKLEVYTNKLEDNLDEEGYGKISVDYKIKFDKFFSRRNILEIEVTPS